LLGLMNPVYVRQIEPYEDLDEEEEDPEEDFEMYSDEEEEDPKMDLDEKEEDLEMDVNDKEEEEPLPGIPTTIVSTMNTTSSMDKDRIEKTQDQDGKQIWEIRHHLTSAEIRLEVANVDRIMPPKRISNAAIERMITDRVDAVIAVERTAAAAKVTKVVVAAETTRAAVTAGGSNNAGLVASARGPNVAGPTVGVVAMNAVP
nr:hypothetical protein [Tanacetum cinerariifolium]